VPLLQGIYGAPPHRIGLSHISLAPYGVFTTRDNIPILISIQNDREWRALCTKVFEKPESGTDLRFATSPARIENRPATDGLVAAWFADHDADAAIAKLDAADIAFGRVNDVHGLHAHPHLRMMTIATPAGPVDLPAPPAQWIGDEILAADTVPVLGSHTRKVREEFLSGR
jgi:itaconate CoA-transferase